jgi:hypothetical protein
MGDSVITVVAIVLAALLMFVFPLMSVSERTDDISQLSVQTATTDFVDKVRTEGKLTADSYQDFIDTITSTGNTYNVEMELQILDENPSVKTTQAEKTKIGENVYYTLYTSQIEGLLYEEDKSGRYDTKNGGSITLKEGDRFSVTVNNTNTTIAQTLRNFFYRLVGNNTYQIAAQQAGIVTVNGSK